MSPRTRVISRCALTTSASRSPSAPARELHVAVRVLLLASCSFSDRHAVSATMPSRHRDDAAPVPVVDALHVGDELFEGERALGQVDEVRAVVGRTAGRRSDGGGQEARRGGP